MKINREIVESFLGKKVEVKLLYEDVVVGILHKTGEEEFKNNPNLYIPKNYYFVIYPFSLRENSFLFRSSQIRKIQEVIY